MATAIVNNYCMNFLSSLEDEGTANKRANTSWLI